ncbi:hypothetical protein B5V03_31685 [Bradyrhizobium betae]|uniref:Uncharacterized protein n=1 Tax=Bradyrhizobium betae TaxID=244734 RepID=A0A4Q1URX6_9BRAD|nr:hypothetical protein B5V03_31685 [Bradyrhizobium betae]
MLRRTEAQQPLGEPVDVDVPRDGHPGVKVEADAAGGVTIGIAGRIGVTLPVTSGTAGVGSSVAELTPRLPISVEPKGRPVLGLPPDVVGRVEVGLEDAAMLLEPEPHMPDMPAVSSAPEMGLCIVADVIDNDEVVPIPDEVDAAVFPTPPVAGVDPAIAIPPPSYVDVEPYIPLGEDPSVEHAVPVVGVAMLPVTTGAGLRPAEGSSVAPKPIPIGEIGEPVVLPSGEVAPTVGVGAAIPVI